MQNTRDLRDFGPHELHLAGRLLSVVKTERDHTIRMGVHIAVEFNPISRYVFLIDERFHIAMLRGDFLEDWLRCPHCEAEGFRVDLELGKECCKAYVKTEFHDRD